MTSSRTVIQKAAQAETEASLWISAMELLSAEQTFRCITKPINMKQDYFQLTLPNILNSMGW